MRYDVPMTNQNAPKAKVVQVKPTWFERFAQWAGITSPSAFVGFTAKILGAYVVIMMAYEKKIDQALFGIIIALLGELLMLTARKFDVFDTLKQSVTALQPTKAPVKLETKLTIGGLDIASVRSGEPTVVIITNTTTPRKVVGLVMDKPNEHGWKDQLMVDVMLDLAGVDRSTHDVVVLSPESKGTGCEVFDVLIARTNMMYRFEEQKWQLWWDRWVTPRLHEDASMKLLQSHAIIREMVKRNSTQQNQDNPVATPQ